MVFARIETEMGFRGTLGAFVCLIAFAVRESIAVQASFKGAQFISHKLKADSMNPRQTTIKLRFRTIHPTGLLLYSKGERGDYLRLEIILGQVRYVYSHFISLGKVVNIDFLFSLGKANSCPDISLHFEN